MRKDKYSIINNDSRKMLKRNRFGFRMRRRSLSGRLFQFLVVLTVVSLFIYLILYSTNFSKDFYGPDFQWLHTRNVSTYIRVRHIFLDFKVSRYIEGHSFWSIWYTETATRADSGQLQFWSEPSEILNLRSQNTPETVAFNIP